jgi:hypothetical protein
MDLRCRAHCGNPLSWHCDLDQRLRSPVLGLRSHISGRRSGDWIRFQFKQPGLDSHSGGRATSMGIAEHLVGRRLPGRRLPGDWIVLERMSRSTRSTTGCCPVGHKVRHESGRTAFMKASDLDLLTEPFVRLQAAVKSQEFERAVLEPCHGNRMDKTIHCEVSSPTHIG